MCGPLRSKIISRRKFLNRTVKTDCLFLIKTSSSVVTAVFTSSHILLVALMQNVFYINKLLNVYDAAVMLETRNFLTINWTTMQYQTIHNKYTAVFSGRVPSQHQTI